MDWIGISLFFQYLYPLHESSSSHFRSSCFGVCGKSIDAHRPVGVDFME